MFAIESNRISLLSELKGKGSGKRWTALLGRRDYPTDGVDDYVRLLSLELGTRGYVLDFGRVSWETEGRLRALQRLWQTVQGEGSGWVFFQYTALSWSRRGFPFLFVIVLWLSRIRRMRIAIVFHDSAPYHGHRAVDRVRNICQRFVMRVAYRLAEKSILPVPLERASWLPRDHSRAVFIPVGANIPATPTSQSARNGHKPRTITVFGVTGNGSVGNELSDIAFVARAAAEHLSGIRLTTLGRGSRESESRLRRALEGCAVEFRALGVLPAGAVSEVLAGADVSLFVRGPISTQRGSAIASLACGTPLVAYSDSLPYQFAEAGVVGVRCGDREGLAQATIRILADRELWLELHRRSRMHFEKYFSWETIAARFVELFDHA